MPRNRKGCLFGIHQTTDTVPPALKFLALEVYKLKKGMGKEKQKEEEGLDSEGEGKADRSVADKRKGDGADEAPSAAKVKGAVGAAQARRALFGVSPNTVICK